MNKSYLQIFQSLFPTRFQQKSGEVDINVREGSLRIPVEMDLYSLDAEFYQALPYTPLSGPCDSFFPDEFIMVEVSVQEGDDPNNHVRYSFDDYDPVFAPNFPTLLITWQVNSAKKFFWSAGGFS